MRILIDARMYGTEHTGIGRYLIDLVSNLQKVDKKNEYLILLKKKYYDSLRLKKSWTKVLVDYGHYGFSEQTRLLLKLRELKFDLVHFPHFNTPLFYNGPFVVTIHDIIMHKRVGKDSTTRGIHVQIVKRVAYKLVFRKAVKSSKKIIAPSKYTKTQLVEKFKLNPEKINVIYEGVADSLKMDVGEQSKAKGKYKSLLRNDYIVKLLE